MPLGDSGSCMPRKGPVPSPAALGFHLHNGVRSGPALLGQALLLTPRLSFVAEVRRRSGALWFQCGGQCNACVPSLLGRRLPETLGQVLVGLEVSPWGAARGTGVPHAAPSALGTSAASSSPSLSFPQPRKRLLLRIGGSGGTEPRDAGVRLDPRSVAQGSCCVFWGINH